MDNKKKIIQYAVYLLIAAILIILLDLFDISNPTQNIIHAGSALRSLSEVAEKINKEIEHDMPGKITLYTKGVSEDDVISINHYIMSLNGCVDHIERSGEVFGVNKVTFYMEESDIYYAYRAYSEGMEIPSDRPEAAELSKAVSDFMTLKINGSMSDYEKEITIHDYITKSCSYSFGDPGNDNEYSAYGALIEGEAVCSGYAQAMGLLLTCAGIENSYIVGLGDGEPHAWNLVCIDGSWYHVDATWDDPVSDQRESEEHTYFNVSDEVMRRMQHEWDESCYEDCSSMDKNYFTVNGIYYDDKTAFENGIKRQLSQRKIGTVQCAMKCDVPQGDSLRFIFDLGGIRSFKYISEGSGDYGVLTLYLNQ